MFEQAQDCPHCGARQDALDPLMVELLEDDPPPAAPPVETKRAPLQVSREEARGIMALGAARAVSPLMEDDHPGLVTWLVMPQTFGRSRNWEILLTVLAFPIFAATILVAGWWMWRFDLDSSRWLIRLAVPVTGAAMFCFCMAYRWPVGWSVLWIGTMITLWLVRGWLRSRMEPKLV